MLLQVSTNNYWKEHIFVDIVKSMNDIKLETSPNYCWYYHLQINSKTACHIYVMFASCILHTHREEESGLNNVPSLHMTWDFAVVAISKGKQLRNMKLCLLQGYVVKIHRHEVHIIILFFPNADVEFK